MDTHRVVLRRFARSGVMLLGSMALVAAAVTKDYWSGDHHSGDRLQYDRPECPVVWDSIPLAFSSQQVDSLQLAHPQLFQQDKRFQLIGPPGNRRLLFVPGGAINPIDGSTTAMGDLPLSGPITNIPEFNDCQRLLTDNGARYDSLFAIFASYRMKETIQGLSWITVVSWTSTNPTVATVNSSRGLIIGKKRGTTQISGVDATGNSVGPFTVIVSGKDVPIGTVGPALSVGPGIREATLAPNETRQLVLQMGTRTVSTMAAATIYSYGPGRPELGIGRNFSCLYVYFDASGALRAKMIPVDRLDRYINACLNAIDPNVAVGYDLSIVRSIPALGAAIAGDGDFPQVARWDSHPVTGQPYIGITCFKAWCEIGPPGSFVTSVSYISNAASRVTQRVVEIKGWYDEQILAAPDKANPGKLRPSGLRGTVIPAPDLGALTKATLTPTTGDTDPWTVVAYVAIRDLANDTAAVKHYQAKLGFELVQVGDLQTLNQMQYCYGTSKACFVPSTSVCDKGWLPRLIGNTRVWVKIVSPSGSMRYFCVTRREHPVFTNPGGLVAPTARWRWILDDETIWTSCVQGCCQTEG